MNANNLWLHSFWNLNGCPKKEGYLLAVNGVLGFVYLKFDTFHFAMV